jgi:hypothetical protein
VSVGLLWFKPKVREVFQTGNFWYYLDDGRIVRPRGTLHRLEIAAIARAQIADMVAKRLEEASKPQASAGPREIEALKYEFYRQQATAQMGVGHALQNAVVSPAAFGKFV